MRPLPRTGTSSRPGRSRVNIDYHVEVDRHYYSVPYQLVHQRSRCGWRRPRSEIFRGRRVASHRRSLVRRGHTTVAEHMPESHRRHAEWTPGRISAWAQRPARPPPPSWTGSWLAATPRAGLPVLPGGHAAGPAVRQRPAGGGVHPGPGLRAFSYRSVESILRTGLDRQPLPGVTARAAHRHPAARQRARRRLLPVKGDHHAHQPHHGRAQAAAARRHGRALAEQLEQPEYQALSFEERLGLLVDRELRTGRTGAWSATSRRPSCGAPPASRTSTSATPAAWTAF